VVIREQQPGDSSGHLCIPQTQHAKLAGQLARAWGGDAFGEPRPRAQLCLAAARHDDGMEGFDSDPEPDPDTGLPRSFMRMPLELWLECWRRGPELVAADDPYAGMLVSLHGEHLLGYRQLDEEDADAQRAVAEWREEQHRLRERLRAECERDDNLAGLLDSATIERARRLVAVWDAMSLAICMPRLPEEFDIVPAAADPVALRMCAPGSPGGQALIEVDPWPFGDPRVPVAASGRRLADGYGSREELRRALEAAPVETLSLTLVPREPEPGPLSGSAPV
jgi:hypothetical protein